MLIVCGLATLAGAAETNESKAFIYSGRAPRRSPATPIVLKAGPHLLLDDFLIESSTNITRQVNVPIRDPAIPNPIVTGKGDG